MGTTLARPRGRRRTVLARNRLFPTVAFLALLVSGCHHEPLINTAPLDSAGMNYDAIQQLKGLKLTAQEVGEFARARQAGLPDASCVEVLRIFRSRGQAFDAGGNAAGLIQAGVSPDAVIELAHLNQLGLGAGELQAMRLAGISDETIVEVARHHAEGRTVLSGASLAGMKNAGLRETTLLELARRGIPDSQTDGIIALRRRGVKDAEILRHFSGS